MHAHTNATIKNKKRLVIRKKNGRKKKLLEFKKMREKINK